MQHDNKRSANPEADQLWKEFERRLDKGTEESLLDLMTAELLDRVADPKNIQCLNYKALADIMGKVQVLQGQIQVMQRDPEMSQEELHGLHARPQILCGKILPHLAVRVRQAPVTLQKKPIQMHSGEAEAHSGQVPAAGQGADNSLQSSTEELQTLI